MLHRCSFIDGPAVGVFLQLQRGPMMLRLVQNAKGEWDALDLLTDKPRKDETVHVYRATGQGTTVHIKAARRKDSGWFRMLEYREWPNPGDEHLRTMEAWHKWCDENREALDHGRPNPHD